MTLRERRERAGLTQAELGEKLNVTRWCVMNWEHGTHTPGGRNIKKLAKALGCSDQDIIDSLDIVA